MVTKTELYRLVDALPDEATDEAALQLRLLALPEDDEPITPDDLAAIVEAEESIAREGMLTLAEWRRRRAERSD